MKMAEIFFNKFTLITHHAADANFENCMESNQVILLELKIAAIPIRTSRGVRALMRKWKKPRAATVMRCNSFQEFFCSKDCSDDWLANGL